ncbi:hypothetical protein V8F33_007628 [Rhypophila sp. PSN 637]
MCRFSPRGRATGPAMIPVRNDLRDPSAPNGSRSVPAVVALSTNYAAILTSFGPPFLPLRPPGCRNLAKQGDIPTGNDALDGVRLGAIAFNFLRVFPLSILGQPPPLFTRHARSQREYLNFNLPQFTLLNHLSSFSSSDRLHTLFLRGWNSIQLRVTETLYHILLETGEQHSERSSISISQNPAFLIIALFGQGESLWCWWETV